MTSIVFVVARMYFNQFKCNYLRNEKLFLNFLLNFRNLHQVLNKQNPPSYLMYFSNYKKRKTYLAKCLESYVSELSSTLNILKGPKLCWNCTIAFLSYYLITLTKIELENGALSDMWILAHFVNTLTADNKYFLHKRGNLLQLIQMQLSKNQKFLVHFCCLSWIYIKCWTFRKKRWAYYLMYFRD